jgi:Raf kinase inhibitor-like YbhB/YbcL family protein
MGYLFSLLLAVIVAQPAPMTLTSPAFKDNAPLPPEFTGYGDYTSPPLSWRGAPKGTREFVLLVEDLDVPLARFSVHWLLYNIPATVTSLSPVVVDRANKTHPSPVKGASQGLNAMKWLGYLPPRPFAGSGLHHYSFTLFALDSDLALADGASKEQVLEAMKGHVIAEAKLVAVYERKEP